MSTESTNARPNILILMADEHRADVAGFAGNTVVRTPTLDWLASTGVVFTNAYTPSPICIPARQCIAAGQFPRTCGAERYGQDLPPNSMTFAKRFSQFGYDTVCCGKLHHVGPDQMQGWRRRIGSNCVVAEDFVDGRDEASFADRPRRSDYGNTQKDAWEVGHAGVGRGSITHVPDEIALLGAHRYIQCHYLDTFYNRCAPWAPTMLKVSFNRPHYPYLTTEDRFAYYLNRVEPYLHETTTDHPFLTRRRVVVGTDVTPREVRRATAAYYGMIDEIDHDFGTVLDELRNAGQNLDDWIIVYTADHGEMLGQHGVWEKQVFYEGSVRVPLIIRWPKRFQPGMVRQNVSTCDLFATLCDLAGVPLPAREETVRQAGLQSRSLVPLLRGESTGWPDEAVSQFDGTNLMIKHGNLKYQIYLRPECESCPEVLFDLGSDPDECRDVLDEPQCAQAVQQFRERALELGFRPPVCTSATSQ